MPSLTRHSAGGLTLLTDATAPGRVSFAFTERTGGVSRPPYASLNLGSRCGDDPDAVAANRARALEAAGAGAFADRVLCPRQVHGDHAVVVRSAAPEALAAARDEAEAGADAVVCTAAEVPVLLCFADCVPVVLVAPDGFAVAHSGWKGTIARIAAKTARLLADESGCDASAITAYVGPHIGAADYEVSPELAERFCEAFGPSAIFGERNLDLGFCVRSALAEAGVLPHNICEVEASTASATDRFFSYRAEHGACGRHAAIAFMQKREDEAS